MSTHSTGDSRPTDNTDNTSSTEPTTSPVDGSVVTDVLVVGGGPAGLQAALTAARVHRTVVIADDARPRNAAASHMHNVVTHDGTPPEEFRSTARSQLAQYPWVVPVSAPVVSVTPHEGQFAARLADATVIACRTVVLATGMRDVLPPIEGIAPLFGRLVHHCPFCHGHEVAGLRVAMAAGERSAHLTALMQRIAGDVVQVPTAQSMRETPSGSLEVTDARGEVILVDAAFVATDLVQRSPLPQELGLALNASGAVRIDLFGRTSLPGVFAAGDMAHHPDLPMPAGSVIAAAAAGAAAGGAAVAHCLQPV